MKSTNVPFSGTCYARSVYLVVDEHGGGTAPIITYPGQTTLVTLDDKLEFDWGGMAHPHFWLDRVGRDLAIRPKKRAKIGTISNAIVRTKSFPLSLRLSVTGKAPESTDLVFVTTRSREAMCRAELSVPLARLEAVEVENVELRKEMVRAEEQCKVNEDRARLREALRRDRYRMLYPLPRNSATSVASATIEPISPQLTRAEIPLDGGRPMIFFTIANQESEPFQLTHLLASSGDGRTLPVQLALLDLPTPEDDGELIASIPAKATTRGVLVLPFELQNSSQPLRLEFASASGGKSVVAATDRWVMRPMTDEEFQQEEWEKEQAEKLAKRYRQRSVNLRLVAGAVWIGDGVGDSQLDATHLFGAALRFQKGYANSFALEGELMGGWTGDAVFDDVALDGTMGDLTRRAVLARAELGIAARLGYKWIFTPRVALALQMARFESAFAPVDGGMSLAPDSSFEFLPALTFGVGVHTHVTDGLVAGAIVSADGLGISVDNLYRRGINASLYFGYGREPSPKKRPIAPAEQ